MENLKKNIKQDWFILVIFLCCLIVILSSSYFLFIKKDFDFIVETSCDTNIEECFVRDCSDPNNCPPNGFSNFKRYALKASDFKYCHDENCAQVCESGEIKCHKIKCIENVDMGESCMSPDQSPDHSTI